MNSTLTYEEFKKIYYGEGKKPRGDLEHYIVIPNKFAIEVFLYLDNTLMTPDTRFGFHVVKNTKDGWVKGDDISIVGFSCRYDYKKWIKKNFNYTGEFERLYL